MNLEQFKASRKSIPCHASPSSVMLSAAEAHLRRTTCRCPLFAWTSECFGGTQHDTITTFEKPLQQFQPDCLRGQPVVYSVLAAVFVSRYLTLDTRHLTPKALEICMNTYRNRRTIRLLALLLLCLLPTAATAAGPIEQPESVQLEYVTGTANYPSHILLEWQSVSEIATVLYRIQRATVNNPAQAILVSSDIFRRIQDQPKAITIRTRTPSTWRVARPTTTGSRTRTSTESTTTHLEPNLVPIVPWGCSRFNVKCNFVIDAQDFTAIANQLELRHRQ